MKTLRPLEIILHCIAAAFLGQALATTFLDVKNYIPAEVFVPGVVLSAIWFMVCLLYPKRVLGQG